MAWVSPRVYAILSKSEEGKDILEGIADKDQKEVDQEVDAFFGEGGKGYKDAEAYGQAKIDDETEERIYKETGDEEVASQEDAEEDEEQLYDEVGTKYKNEQGASFKRVEDTKDGEVQIQFNDADKTIRKMSKEAYKRMIEDNGYKVQIPEDVKEFTEELYKDTPAEDMLKENGQKEPKELDDIIKERSTFTKDKDYDAYSFKKELEENGHKVEYIENRSGTWQDHNGEKYKEYDIKLEGGQHIYFKLIADENYDTKEIIAYKNGKNW